MDDKELFRQLRSGPFSREGFDENLRRKIHANLNEPQRGERRPFFLRRIAAASFLLVLAAVVAVWGWNSLDGKPEPEELAVPTEQAPSTAGLNDGAEGNPNPHSAVVIGLRKDETSDRSSYRTIVVAAENERLQVIGSGSGIWMPYGQNFWHIEAVDDSAGTGAQQLIAHKNGVKTVPEKIKEVSPARMTEKLLYAGDHYVSILLTKKLDSGARALDQSEVVVNLLPTLAPANRAANADALAVENVALNEALGFDHPTARVERWAVVRENNAWVAKSAARSSGAFDPERIKEWPTVEVPLESTDIVKDKPLSLAWEEVKRLEPEAVDAFTSQDGDVAVIVSDDQIRLVPYRQPESERQTVTLDIDANESVVMVQWAIQEKYVENWKKWFRNWFSDSSR
ncbi:hypothetical protein [Cohnella hongkongensis]|uniref:SH3 domain-containing protein n=1 Tax=Cohnella hongkongensis TaxID=178337 RepID=A0ABV9FA01_9BACL